ncbi:hypothetical protein PSENEW3n2_00003886 [Picochlorum sp. SENEW3]|nr:hypothetical protein PSENEW3n2_00003886 [Picochlorum sp. SENEW3]WPT18586.1 hypothetical protein PSENEW3_00003886 [Picochlorum sp. SENEW3]
MSGIPMGNGSRYYPLILGVGPAKTGSTALFSMLGGHPEIGLADARAAKKGCCGSESYFFSQRWPLKNYYYEYGRYFSKVQSSPPTIKYLAEKTPNYHDNPLTPTRIMQLLHPSNTLLVFTLRDPIDAHISLFFHRNLGKNLTLPDFFRWSQLSLLSFDAWKSCIASAWKSLGYPVEPTTMFSDMARISVTDRCSKYYHEGVAQYRYSETLPYWEKWLPDFPKICVLHSKLITMCSQVMDGIQTVANLTHHDLCVEPFAMPSLGINRLLDLNGTDPQRQELQQYHLHLQKYFESDAQEMNKFCSRYTIE